jgi:hypothetical protein
MASPLSLENRLILACARTATDVDLIQDLVDRGPDWELVLQRAARWRLAPLVYVNVRQAVPFSQVPEPVTSQLRSYCHRATIRSVAWRKLLRAALQRLSAADVPVIVLKGAALSALVYPSPALRPMGDIDLLVRRRDLGRADELVRGLTEVPGLTSQSSLLDVRAHIFSPDHSAPKLPSAARIPTEDFWERALPAEIESVATLVFSNEDLLLHLALHLVYGAGFAGRVTTLCDIGATCQRLAEAIDWSRFVTLAERYSIGKELYHALHLGRELIGARVPATAFTELRATFGQLLLEHQLIAATTRRAILSDDQVTGPLSTAARLATHIVATDRARDGITMISRAVGHACQVRLQRLVTRPDRGRQIRGTRAPTSATAIVLPIHRPSLEADVIEDVDRSVELLRHGDWHLIAPRSMDTSFYETRYGKPIIRVPDDCLASVQNYSRLLLTDEFYAAFAQYEYMLVVQDDVFVVRDDLPHWLSRRLDYIGAPWPRGHEFALSMSHRPGIRGQKLRVYVGNGGFSLRRIAACRQLLAEFAEEVAGLRENEFSEDTFFGLFGQVSERFVLPSLREAAGFAWEAYLPHMYALCQGQLPMAIHGHRRFDPEFFDDIILPAALSRR